LPTPVITLNTDGSGEKGLLSLALDPNFATNGYMYVSYTTLDEHAQLSRFTVELFKNIEAPREFMVIAYFESEELARAMVDDLNQDAWFFRLVSLIEEGPACIHYYQSAWRAL